MEYKRVEYYSNGESKLDINLSTNMDFSSTYSVGTIFNGEWPHTFSVSFENSSSNTTETRVWHYANKPDSTHVDNLSVNGPVSIVFYGTLDIDYPVWR